MQVRKIVFALAAVALVGLLALLMMKVKASPKQTVSDAEIARATAAHTRDNMRAAERSVVKNTFKPGPVRRRKPLKSAADPRARRDPPFDSPGGYVGVNKAAGFRPKFSGGKMPATVRVDKNGNKGLAKRMNQTNKHYDRGDYETAQTSALKILEGNPNNIRMLRVVVSSACMMGDGDKARSFSKRLPARDKRQLATRCKRFDIDL